MKPMPPSNITSSKIFPNRNVIKLYKIDQTILSTFQKFSCSDFSEKLKFRAYWQVRRTCIYDLKSGCIVALIYMWFKLLLTNARIKDDYFVLYPLNKRFVVGWKAKKYYIEN